MSLLNPSIITATMVQGNRRRFGPDSFYGSDGFLLKETTAETDSFGEVATCTDLFGMLRVGLPFRRSYGLGGCWGVQWSTTAINLVYIPLTRRIVNRQKSWGLKY